GSPVRSVQLRFQHRGDQVLPRAAGGRHSAAAAVQRNRALRRRPGTTADRPHPVEPRGALQPRVLYVERPARQLLPERRMALPAESDVRAALRLQAAREASILGARARPPARTRRRRRQHHGARAMSGVDAIVKTILYEGYVLYPYRPTP